MKIKKISKKMLIILAACVILIAAGLYFIIGIPGGSPGSKTWVAKIEGEVITLDDFNVRFEYYLKSKYMQQPDMIPRARNSMEERKLAMRDMINERLILQEARKLKVHEKDEVKDMIRLYQQQIVLNSYIEQNLAGDIKVAEADIDAYYGKNRKKFRGMDPDKVRFLIRRELSMKQYEIKLKEILDTLKNKYRIKENESAIRPIMGELNIPQPQVGGTGMPVPRPKLPGTPAPKTGEAKTPTPTSAPPKDQ